MAEAISGRVSVLREKLTHPHCPAPRAPADDAYPPPPGTIPPGVDPDDWERNLHRVLDGMQRTINPASARIVADLLADDRASADKPTPRRPG